MQTDETKAGPARPIFIIGAPRSGTSVMTWVLSQHPNIQPMPETYWIAATTVGAYQAHLAGSGRGEFSHLSNVRYPLERFLERHGAMIDGIVHEAYRQRCYDKYGEAGIPTPRELEETVLIIRRRLDDPKRRWVDGAPLNSFYVWGLAHMFPEARFLHHLRAPHAVAASLAHFDRVGAAPQELEPALHTWIAHARAAWAAEQALGQDRVKLVDFERLETEPQTLVAEILAFLTEPACSDCLIPLRERLNSSQTHGEADALLHTLAPLPLYREARTLYDQIRSAPRPIEGGDSAAMDRLRRVFTDRADGHSLLG